MSSIMISTTMDTCDVFSNKVLHQPLPGILLQQKPFYELTRQLLKVLPQSAFYSLQLAASDRARSSDLLHSECAAPSLARLPKFVVLAGGGAASLSRSSAGGFDTTRTTAGASAIASVTAPNRWILHQLHPADFTLVIVVIAK